MALKIKEQLDILDGTVKPSDAAANFSFEAIVRQVTITQANDFISTQKEPPIETEPDAYLYANAMLTISRTALTTVRSSIFNNIARLLIAIYAEDGDITTVIAADEDAWTTFVINNMLEAFESYAGVKPSEKVAYDNYGVTTTTTTTV